MKNISLIVLIILYAQSIHAQESEADHSFILGGSVSFSIQTNNTPFSIFPVSLPVGGIYTVGLENAQTSHLLLTPYIGKQLNERWLVGMDLRYQSRNYEARDVFFPDPAPVDIRQVSRGVGVGLFARYSFMSVTKFDFYIQPFTQYFTVNDKEFIEEELENENNANYIAAGSDLGITYNISDHWRATLRIGGLRYINGSWKDVETSEGNDFSSFGLSASLANLGLGVEYKL